MSKKFIIPHSSTWLRPDQAYFEYQEQSKGISPDKVEWDGKYKRIRELRDLSIFGLAFYTMQKHSCFVQMNDLDPSPDAFLMRSVSRETNEIAPIEITFYGRNKIEPPQKSLVDKLSETKGKFHKLPDGYWLLIHIGKGLEVDHEAVESKMQSLSAKFKAFSIQEVSSKPDTIARVVSYSPKLEAYDINVGGIAHTLSKTKIPGTLTVKKGVSKQHC